ncbi:hypothetical protein M0R04_10450 [Candidatus Dojkabacteria bacterium]|jgi:hypothetical protein|nr:hypothetical protein [Candidatus Dojkabacteria bacterium]
MEEKKEYNKAVEAIKKVKLSWVGVLSEEKKMVTIYLQGKTDGIDLAREIYKETHKGGDTNGL